MKIKGGSVVAGIFLIVPTALAQQLYPYACTWKSQVTPGAKIQFTSTNGIGGYQGALYMDGKWIINFREGSFQGYGSNWWSPTTEGQDKPGGGTIVMFKNGVPFRSSTAGVQKYAPTRLLTVGLGSTLYYGNQRGNYALIKAAEGFWIPQKGCRHINGRY